MITEGAARAIERAISAAAVYRDATGVGCIVLDAAGERVDRSEADGSGCDACTALRADAADRGGRSCYALHAHGVLQAERFGGSYVYLCPIGMLHWASPVYSGGLPAGSMIGGPVRSIDRDEALAAIRDAGAVSGSDQDLIACIDRIPGVRTERVHALAELLSIAASQASDDDRAERDLEEARRRTEQQSRISEEIHSIKRRNDSGSEISAYPIDKERELLFAIRQGDEATSRRVLNELLGAVFFTGGHRFETIRFRGLELLVLLSRAAMEAGAEAEEILGLNFRYLRRFQDLDSTEDLAYLLDTMLGRFMRSAFSLRSVKHATAFKRALRHIRDHYAEELTLADVAAHAGLSPSYFSKVFKAELGESFSEHVNRLRVERAVLLLKDTAQGLSQIAGAVGFEDQSYFTKVFKRLMGVSPGRFREAGGRRPAEVDEIHEALPFSSQES